MERRGILWKILRKNKPIIPEKSRKTPENVKNSEPPGFSEIKPREMGNSGRVIRFFPAGVKNENPASPALGRADPGLITAH